MPFIGELEMEFCDAITEPVTKEALLEAIRKEPRDVDDWFLTLSRTDDDYMDATMEGEGSFSVRWGEGEKTLASTSPIDQALLEALFLSYFEHDGEWKRLCTWEEPRKKGFLATLFS